MKKELLNNTNLVPLLTPTTTALSEGTTVTNWVSRDFFLSAIAGIATGVATGSPTSYTVTATVQTASDASGTDDANLTDINGDDITIELTEDSTYGQVGIDLIGGQEYFGLSIVVAFADGTTPTVPVTANVVLGDPSDTREI